MDNEENKGTDAPEVEAPVEATPEAEAPVEAAEDTKCDCAEEVPSAEGEGQAPTPEVEG